MSISLCRNDKLIHVEGCLQFLQCTLGTTFLKHHVVMLGSGPLLIIGSLPVVVETRSTYVLSWASRPLKCGCGNLKPPCTHGLIITKLLPTYPCFYLCFFNLIIHVPPVQSHYAKNHSGCNSFCLFTCRLSSSKVGDAGTQALAKCLQHCTELQELL